MKHCVLFWIYYFKTFSRLFPSNNFFFHSQHYQIDDRDLKETEEQSFFSWYAVNVRARLSKIWPIQKRCHLKSTCSSFQKNLKTSFLFPRLFSGLENCCANFKTFSRIHDFVWTLHSWANCRLSVRQELGACPGSLFISGKLSTYPSP